MTESAEHPAHDPSADEELSTSLEGHDELAGDSADDAGGAPAEKLSDTADSPTSASADAELSASLEGHSELPDGDSDVLEEIDDSPVNTENS
ncbi:hypothetical protein AC792_10730 [Arthrobacter sp. RIT-PI-e]|uniref:hypothetical protein n=1 Tax=Arthrobacter sp. RIT-PI-e TaxID=1681197 RepID=UPI0006760E01|nr:hypothetical protein [Arthrobacter sp. RIT-PI-e]KNC18683.1 hypothetical protein AC792_10730 [Arthrobacter sp. RIT-PI-e]